MLHFKDIADAEGTGTLLSSSIQNFQKFLDAPFSGSPVEACWNSTTERYNTKKNAVEKTVDFVPLHYLCLRPFSINYKNPTDAFLMKITNKSERPGIVKEFYKYLLSKDSPWKDALKSVATVKTDAYGIPEGILWYDTSNSCSKLVMNLLTAMRLHTCWGLDFIWLRLVDAGFSEEEALLLCTNFSWQGQSITATNGPDGKFDADPYAKLPLSRLGCSKTDMPFNTNFCPSGFAPLFEKKPSFSGKSLTEKQNVQPNNFIWHADRIEVNADNLTKSSPEYKNGNIHVSKTSTPLYTYLKKGNTKLSKDYVKEVQEKLHKNLYLEV